VNVQNMKSLSWSELWLIENDFSAWYMRYIVGIPEKETPSMQKGTKIHNILQSGILDTENLDKSEIRIYSTILKTFEDELVKLNNGRSGIEWEHKSTTVIDSVPTIGFWDGLMPCGILEIKTGANLWTREKAEGHGQLAFYALQHGKNPDIWLFSADATNGRCKMFHVKHTYEQLENMRKRIKIAWEIIAPYHRQERNI
jgi:hypothetical protein